MTNRKTFSGLALVALVAVTLFSINSCKTDNNPQPLEPISLVSPDTPISRYFGGDSFPVVIKFTTDRPINWIMCVYDVDTSVTSTNYVPTYPDTLFFHSLQALNPQVNLYTDTSSYRIPNWLVPFSVVRFKVTFQAGSASATYGQNYPIGLVSDQKEFLINIL